MSLRTYRPPSLLLILLAVLIPFRFAAANNADWMRWLPDSASIASLSLPGTHDTMSNEASGAVAFDLYWVLTQSMELRPQLDAGVRVLDIRARHFGNHFTIHHGPYYVGANFDQVLSTATQFLAEHPSETLLMRIKPEHTEELCTRTFAETFEWYRDNPAYSPFIWQHNYVPTLGEVRGKIVILDEFSGGAHGINWASLNIQDAWNEGNTHAKWDLVRNHLEASDNGPANVLYVNFLSASAPMDSNCADPFPLYGTPRCIANALNAELHNYVVDGDVQRTGAVMMDFPEQWILDAIIPLNAQGGIPSFRGSSGGYAVVGTTLEVGIGRPGMDYMNFALQEARPELCRNACFGDAPRCKSFTYAKPGVHSIQPRCFLKSGIPAPVLNADAVSGTTLSDPQAGLVSGLVEANVDRPGMDYRSFALPEARPELCREACLQEPQTCKAFTYARPGPDSPQPMCYLKNGVPEPVSNPWCDSGVSSATAQPALEYFVDRPGMDYRSFALPAEAGAEQCRTACMGEPQTCKAFTFAVTRSADGQSQATCYLKNGIPALVYSFWTVSGVQDTNEEYAVGTTLEEGIDRPGMDYRSIALPEARPELCRKACFDNAPACQSFTYLKPGVDGPQARCFLKNGIPAPVFHAGADSGTTQAGRQAVRPSGLVERNVNRGGQDYRNFIMPEARPELCREECLSEAHVCRAFTYAKPGVHGPEARCFLKSGTPAPVPDPGADSGLIPKP